MTFLFSEHILYIYEFTHQILCCMFVLGYTVLSWCSFSSTGVLNFNVSLNIIICPLHPIFPGTLIQ